MKAQTSDNRIDAPIKSEIAAAIKAADRSFFNENYNKQAEEVIKILRKKGYAIVPIQPDEDSIKDVADNIPSGRMNKYELMRALYAKFLEKLALVGRVKN